MPYNRKAFGLVISRLRVSRGLTQEKMSGLAGISRSHLATLESGEKTVRLDTLWNIAYALDLKPSELVRLTEKELISEIGGQKGENKIRVVIRKYRKDSGAGLEGEILRNDALEVDYGMDHADEYDEIYGDMEEDDEDDEHY